MIETKRRNQIISQIIEMSIFKLLHQIVIYDISITLKKVFILLVVGYITNKTKDFGMT